jgi:hypothetical protein
MECRNIFSSHGNLVATNPGAGTGFIEKLISEARGLRIPTKQAELVDDVIYEVFDLMERVAQACPNQGDVELLPVLGIKTLAPKLDHYSLAKVLQEGGRSIVSASVSAYGIW